ncbi:MAG: hypothetical protein LC099_02700 [Anaerolineales bacterium]|nr:hypothetical protein [Anaerolineales bacterium]
MKRSFPFFLALILIVGFGLGLAYSWLLAPVSYVDAPPSLLGADFKEQYRSVVAAAYAANQDLPRARARLDLLRDADSIKELSAQAQRMLAAGADFEKTRPLAQLAADLRQGYVSEPFTPSPFPTFAPNLSATITPTENSDPFFIEEEATATPFSAATMPFQQTPITPIVESTAATPTLRPTFTPTAGAGAPFVLVSQEAVCDEQPPTMRFTFLNAKKIQVAGVEIVATWNDGEDRFFSGFKPEMGNGYADFQMRANTIYNIRIVNGGTFVADLSAPECSAHGQSYLGSLSLVFQR